LRQCLSAGGELEVGFCVDGLIVEVDREGREFEGRLALFRMFAVRFEDPMGGCAEKVSLPIGLRGEGELVREEEAVLELGDGGVEALVVDRGVEAEEECGAKRDDEERDQKFEERERTFSEISA
jgi:hypothetical protein